MATKAIYDALIIGGGPAGLSTALGLGRVHRTCVVFSDSVFRNQGAHAAHAILTRDHTPPEEIRAIGRQQLDRYGNTRFVDRAVTKIEKIGEDKETRFVAEDANGEKYTGRTVVMATGGKDIFPDLEGYADNWPENIYQCLFCDGHEKSHLPIGVLGYPKFEVMHSKLATMSHFLSQTPDPTRVAPSSYPPVRSNVTVFTNGPVDTSIPELKAGLDVCIAHGIQIDQRPVTKLVRDANEGVHIHLAGNSSNPDSSSVHLGFLVHKPPIGLSAKPLIDQLGLETADSPFGKMIKVSPPFQMTSVPGVFSAGDAATMFTSVTSAMFLGGMAAAGVAHMCGDRDDAMALEVWKKGLEQESGK